MLGLWPGRLWPCPRKIRLTRMDRVTITTWMLWLTRLNGCVFASGIMASISIPTRLSRATSLSSLPCITNMNRLNRLTRMTRIPRPPILTRMDIMYGITGKLS